MRPALDLWSSVELGAFARGLITGLRAAGFDATQRFEVTEETYRHARNTWARAHVRWSSYVSYPLRLRARLRHGQGPDVMIVCTNTFYAPTIALRAARQRVPVINWIFDLFPDVLVAGKKIRPDGFWERRLGELTRATFREAAANVFLGERLRRYAEARYGPVPRAHVIPVGADSGAFGDDPPQARPPGQPLRVLYCGNLGRMHDTATLAALFRDPGPSGWTLAFRGHGAGFRDLEAAHARADGRVTFGHSRDDAEWSTTMRAADIALVTMKPGAEGLVMPSKTYSAMMAGQAILAICPLESDLADTVLRDDAGWVVAPGDADGLRAVLAAAAAAPEQVTVKRMNAFRAGRDRYGQAAVATRWAELIRPLLRGPAGEGRDEA